MWMSACILSIVNMHDANATVKNLIPNISNKGQIPLISKGYKRLILKIEHMTWTYDPKTDQKETLKVGLTDTDANIPFFIFSVWLPLASSLPKVRLRFKVRKLCSSLGVVTHSFCLTDICSKPLASSWSTFFSSSSVFGLHRSEEHTSELQSLV